METPGADIIFLGGTIITMCGDVPDEWEQQSVAIKEGFILEVGPLEKVMQHKSDATHLIDLQGCVLVPGFIEPHTHWGFTALHHFSTLQLAGFTPTTAEDVWDMVREEVKSTPKGQWVIGSGINSMLVPGLVIPTRRDLDLISKDHPIILFALSLHAAYCNTLALTMSGVDKEAQILGKDVVMLDVTGELTGELHPPAIARVRSQVFKHITNIIGTPLLKKALNGYILSGVTTIGDTGFFSAFDDSEDLMTEIVRAPDCPVRVVMYGNTAQKADTPLGQRGKYNNLCYNGQKFFADGSPYTGTMACGEPYIQTPFTSDLLRLPSSCTGKLTYPSVQALYEVMEPHHVAGRQLATHAHVERAIEQVLKVYELLLSRHPRPDHRHRIEHCGLITRQQLTQAKHLDVSLSFYPGHHQYYGDVLRYDILGEERADRFMPVRSALKAGHKPSLHADSPCLPTNVLDTMQSAVTRQPDKRYIRSDRRSTNHVSTIFDETITIDKALKACTVNAAHQLFHDRLVGSIEKGKVADFTVLSKNPRTVQPEYLNKIKVCATYKNGVKVKLYDVE